MKVGDLVRWTYPGAENIGLVVKMGTLHEQADPRPVIMWIDFDGAELPTGDHKFLELVAES